MKLLIEIPKEFEEKFLSDKFENSLYRMYSDMHIVSGINDMETVKMIMTAFKKSKIIDG